jgi:hypothetical protein
MQREGVLLPGEHGFRLRISANRFFNYTGNWNLVPVLSGEDRLKKW